MAVVVAVRSMTPFRGVDRGIVHCAVGCEDFRVESGDFDFVVGRCELRFDAVEGFEGVTSTTPSSSETIAARGVILFAGEIITT